MATLKTTLRRRTYDFLEMGSFGSLAGSIFEGFMIALIIANVTAVALETVDSLWAQYATFFRIFDLVSVIIFSIEFLVRLWASVERTGNSSSNFMSRLRFIFQPMSIIDLLAILPFYLMLSSALDLRFLRIFRLLRLLKLVRYSPAMSSLTRVIYAERKALFAALVIMIGLVFFAASFMYLIEKDAQPDSFGNIPQAIWWALTTLTTVGYGDVVPITAYGKLLGGTVMIFGLAFYAIPIGIIASGFSDEIHRREFVVPDAVIAKSGIFEDMPEDVRTELMPRLRSMAVSQGTVITHRRDDENGLFVIIAGEATAFFHHRSIPLMAGDILGEYCILMENGCQPAVVARTACRLLWIEGPDLHILMSIWLEAASRIREYANVRHREYIDDGYLSLTESEEIMALLDTRLPVLKASK